MIYFPASLFMTPSAILSTTTILPVAVAATIFNRKGKPLVAGIIIVVACEAALSSLALTTIPLDSTSIDLYELLVIGELLAGALLPARAIFIAAFFNSTVVTISLLYQPKNAEWSQVVHQHFAAILLNQVGVQLLVAVVVCLWVSSALRAIMRADRAEVVASLERQMAQQTAQVAEEKRRLEEAINGIVQSHIDTMNNKVVTKIPFSEETKVLWPLINVIDSLQRRLRGTQQSEYELQYLKKAISEYAEFFRNGGVKQPLLWRRTRTELDTLLFALNEQLSSDSTTSVAPPVKNRVRKD